MTKNDKAPPVPISDERRAFEASLAARFPNANVKGYELPKQVREVSVIFMRELSTSDMFDAAIMAEVTMSGVERASTRLASAAELREAVRKSCVGIGVRNSDNQIVYRHVNDVAGVPFDDMNRWGKRCYDAMTVYYNDVNGLPSEEFFEGLMEARVIGAPAAPTSGTPASASTGPRAG